MSSLPTRSIRMASFNLLADGLAYGEFLCPGGDQDLYTKWSYRENMIINVLESILRQSALVVTQENDHFYGILSRLRERVGPNISGILGLDYNKVTREHSTSYNIWKKRSSETTLDPPRTFQEECREFTNEALSIYSDITNQDPYIYDSGIAVYYDNSILDLVSVTDIGKDIVETVSDETKPALVTTADYCLKLKFRFVNQHSLISLPTIPGVVEGQDGKIFLTVYGGHLKSGEGVDEEIVRYNQLKQILSSASSDLLPVILMDSNNSPLYELQYPSAGSILSNNVIFPMKLSELIAEYGMVDVLRQFQPRGNECLKMRNGLSNQVTKQFGFMFDTIDKLLIPSRYLHLVDIEEKPKDFGFRRYNEEDYDYFHNLRTNEEARVELKNYCMNHIGKSTSCAVNTFGAANSNLAPFVQLYPNENACSDHPPVSFSIKL